MRRRRRWRRRWRRREEEDGLFTAHAVHSRGHSLLYIVYFTVECVLHYRRRGAARGGRFMHKANAVNEVDFRVGGGVEGSDKWSFNHHLSNMIIYQTHFSIFIKHWRNVPRRQADVGVYVFCVDTFRCEIN